MTHQSSETSPRSRVLFIDRDHMIRAAVTRMLDQTQDLCCVEALASTDDLIFHVQRTKADAVVIRLRPNLTNDLEAIRALASSPAQVPLLACPDSPDPSTLRAVIAAGASAVITTDDEPVTVLLGIREALADHPFIAPKAAELLHTPSR